VSESFRTKILKLEILNFELLNKNNMSFIKGIFEIVLATIVIFFVWNILKRIFFKKFYNFMGFKPNNSQQQETKNSKTNIEKKVKWDAETVDYEEVKEKR